ncbi:hypothetical protein NQ317_019337 [Molorchus minor]|uniref:Uncharacterized protein n=1 Tax=Molorchus minor TaxID=1323400 RepID=A0ABQ9J053_9CUCU|nr:hypothetical protein NQ317_019337 [Molorchus minor]
METDASTSTGWTQNEISSEVDGICENFIIEDVLIEPASKTRAFRRSGKKLGVAQGVKIHKQLQHKYIVRNGFKARAGRAEQPGNGTEKADNQEHSNAPP